MIDIHQINYIADVTMLFLGLVVGLIFGRHALASKADPLSFCSDAALFGLAASLVHYGFTTSTFDRMLGWVLMLLAFYFGDRLRIYIKKQVIYVHPKRDSQPFIKA